MGGRSTVRPDATRRRASTSRRMDGIMEPARQLPLTRQVLAERLGTAAPAQMEFHGPVDERGDRIQGGVQTRAPAQAGGVPGRQGTRRLRLGERAHAGGPATERTRGPRIPRRAGGLGHVRPSRHRQDPSRHRVGPRGMPPGRGGEVLHRRGPGHAPPARRRGGQTRQGTAIHRQGRAPRHRRARLRAHRRGGSRLLFQVVANAYEARSVIYTTNIEFSGWGRVFGDPNMAAAIIDRTVHHRRMIRSEGESHRRTHALMQ